ncbi:dihydrolipoyl dehydrogenase [Alkaliphilus serpentinus]|uniref:Dihydrolipoyl dehydrogenase n=1 Tax=Alkaliphilus serpentinus TaxID=1482731 RepID=A0A833HPP5_9FIRM|nr:dihydrolipoyl dehydrogenase [Alkaliphilus serpentinus]KAB3531099.1 dihydrolipoyl dehydrogenase [Alkaliphilus serpentinus]
MRVAVIGGGPGGYIAAIKAAMLGAEVTLLEKAKVGGTCLNAGCIPTKALLASAEKLNAIKEAEEFGISIDGKVNVNFEVMMERKDKTIEQMVKGIKFLLEKRKVRLLNGFGKLVEKNKIEVQLNDGSLEIIEADKIILATGSVPIIPPLFPYDGNKVITSNEALFLKEMPESLIIVGGGVIGCEFGQFFNKLGTKVTVIEMAEQLLPPEDKDTAKQLERAFKKDKIKVMTNAKIVKCEVIDNQVVATLEDGKVLTAEKILISVGRKPYLEDLGVEDIGIHTSFGKIIVNDKMETNIEGVYGIGDIINSPFLAHVATKEGTIAAENAMGLNKKINYKAIPRCVYTDPEVASVGLTEKEATAKGIQYNRGQFDFRALGKAQVIGRYQGFIKIIVDAEDKIIGAAIVGPHATDLLAELTLAVHLGITAQDMGEVIHPHPTLTEGIMEALHDVHKSCLHSV